MKETAVELELSLIIWLILWQYSFDLLMFSSVITKLSASVPRVSCLRTFLLRGNSLFFFHSGIYAEN